MKSKLTGPPLAGVEERWETKEKLYSWIRNSQALIASGDAFAKKVFMENGRLPMNSFPELSDEDINGILEYIKFKSE